MEILVILTCYNRREKTENCIRSLVESNPDYSFTFIIVDDNSGDGTREVIEKMKTEYDIFLLQGEGNLFYSGGMRLGMQYALDCFECLFAYLLMVNDDVIFYQGCITRLVLQSREQGEAVIVGTTSDEKGRLTYGAIKYVRGIKYRVMGIDEWFVNADTFNANCVLVPYSIFRETGALDPHYVHSLGDFDYGLSIKRKGYFIYPSKEYAGACEGNSNKNTWTDTTLRRLERIRRKEAVKGAPLKQWFYFLRKNFGVFTAIKASCTPYIRILLGK